MWVHWTTLLIAAAILVSIGILMWVDAAAILVRAVAPSSNLLTKESRLCTFGVRMAIVGVALAVVGAGMAIAD